MLEKWGYEAPLGIADARASAIPFLPPHWPLRGLFMTDCTQLGTGWSIAPPMFPFLSRPRICAAQRTGSLAPAALWGARTTGYAFGVLLCGARAPHTPSLRVAREHLFGLVFPTFLHSCEAGMQFV